MEPPVATPPDQPEHTFRGFSLSRSLPRIEAPLQQPEF